MLMLYNKAILLKPTFLKYVTILERNRFFFFMQAKSCNSTAPNNIYQKILDETEVSIEHLTPYLKLHLITPNCGQWYSRNSLFGDPFWAFYWPGGQGISRYISDWPSLVQNKRILDFGCGGGASGLCAKMLGAKSVFFNDIDPVAKIAVELNAQLNNVVVDEYSACNLVGSECEDVDVILVGDVLYDAQFADRVMKWLHHLSKRKSIYIGDPGRFALKEIALKRDMILRAKYYLSDVSSKENNGFVDTSVWTFSS